MVNEKTPDWKRIVSKHTGGSAGGRGRPPLHGNAMDDDVVAELAAHLEEVYDASRSRGMKDEEATATALQEVGDWNVLAAAIVRAKSEEDAMNQRTKSLWLPAMASLTGAALLLLIIQKLGVQPRIVWMQNSAQQKMAMVFYMPWLIALPAFGALGALLARRSQASTLHRLVAGTAPALAMLGAFAVLLPVSLVLDRTAHLSGFPWIYFGLTMLNWIGLPALALLIGALPFLREHRRQSVLEPVQ